MPSGCDTSAVNMTTNVKGEVILTHITDDCVNISELTPTPLTTQIAGHAFSKEKKMGMMSFGPTLVLKGMQDPPRGQRELEFYQKTFSPSVTDSVTEALRKFLPAFHGVVEVDGGRFLKMENITGQYKKPSIADLKMGKITYDPFATPEKVARESTKCPSAAVLGFQICGMMVYQPATDEYSRMEKKTGHKLTPENMLTEGIGKFFGYPHLLRKDVIESLIVKLKDIESWFETQKQYAFYASSLLIVYEGQITDTLSPDSQNNMSVITDSYSSPRHNTTTKFINAEQKSVVDVRMIDFAHVFPSTEIDNNYLSGLKTLIEHLGQLLQLQV